MNRFCTKCGRCGRCRKCEEEAAIAGAVYLVIFVVVILPVWIVSKLFKMNPMIFTAAVWAAAVYTLYTWVRS
jgi:hypothetical protein